MPTADILTVADAVVTAINAATLSQSVTASRAYLATRELQSSTDLAVTVLPASDAARLDTRTSAEHEYTIHISVQQKLSAVTAALVDPLVLLTQEIADLLLYDVRTGGAKLISPTVRTLFVEEHLRELTQFTAVIELTFRGWREAS